MNIDVLTAGLIAFTLGLIGLTVKMKDYDPKSYTALKFLWST
jgi:hypothetical protein